MDADLSSYQLEITNALNDLNSRMTATPSSQEIASMIANSVEQALEVKLAELEMKMTEPYKVSITDAMWHTVVDSSTI